MSAPLTGLGSRPAIPDLPRCACGCRRAASRGFPGDVHYAHTCVPPALRFPWEPGYEAPAAAPELTVIAAAPAAQADLLSGFAPA
ncbi:hypothetical protein [Methylobacterium fujisawaense]|jgi:hypothetical protein|uniref:hypothetical protein n=1 Tax=Methylobacterium fujisawaense TaxID=107400 RepID=UPI00313B0CF7